MIRHSHPATGFCLVLLLSTGLTPKPALAEDGRRDRPKPIRLYAKAAFGPIGVAYSLGRISINGRSVHGEEMIWHGDLIEATADTTVRVWLDSVCEVMLKGAAKVRLATTLMNSDDTITRRVLVASLISGDMIVRLDKDAQAYIESCETVFTSSVGAAFRITVREGQAVFDTVSGTVSIQRPPRPPTIKPASVQVQPNGSIIELPPNTSVDTKAGKTVAVSSKWKKRHDRRISRLISFTSNAASPQPQAQQIEEPVAFRKVHFKVDPSVGTIDPEGTTDNDGVVTVIFTAGPKAGSGTIVGIIDRDPTQDSPDTQYEDYRRRVRIIKFPLWIPLVGGAAAAAIVVEEFWRRGKRKIQQVPPPIIN